MSNDIPDWLNNLAAEIHSLIKKYDAADRFKEMVNIHIEKDINESKEKRAWLDKRAKYFEEQVNKNTRLQNEKAGPPENNWVWEHGRVQVIENDKSKRIFIQGWIPAELSISNEPEIKNILPLDSKMDYSIEDKYACLVAIYYRFGKGVEKYDIFPEKFDIEDDLDSLKALIAYLLKRNVDAIKEDENVWFKHMLEDVEEDLKRNKPKIPIKWIRYAVDIAKQMWWYIKKYPVRGIIVLIAIVVAFFHEELRNILMESVFQKSTIQNEELRDTKEELHNFVIVKTHINRFIGDFNLSVKKYLSEFPDESARIAHSANLQGMYFSGPHLKIQWKAAIDYRMKIDVAKRNLVRQLEDLLIKYL